jgi:hypothetical protein
MWGGSKTIDCVYTGIFSTTTSTEQLNRISYGRPETWNFFFLVRVVQMTLAVQPPIVSQIVEVNFNLTIGIGRGSTTITGFERYRLIAVAGTSLQGQEVYSNSVHGPVRNPNDPTAANEIRDFVAQDIQLNVDATYASGDAAHHGDLARIQVDTYFSPVSHIRPEWYERRFPGGEDHGA